MACERTLFCTTQGLQGGIGMKGEKGIPGFPGPRVSISNIYILQGMAKKYLPKNFGNISTVTENFYIKFYTPILCLYLCKITKFYSVISNFDKVKLY